MEIQAPVPAEAACEPAPRPVHGAVQVARLVDAILDAVTNGRLLAGTRLREAELASLFGLSRNVVREALKVLAERGVVVLLPHRGATLADPSPQEVRETFAARALIEGAMMEEMAQHVTAADIRRLRAHLARQRAAQGSGDRREQLRLSGEFHLLLAGMHGNAVLTETLGRLIARTSLINALQPPDSLCAGVAEHAAIVEALAAGDGATARRVAEAHLLENLGRLRGKPRPAPVDLRAALLPGTDRA